MDKYNYTIGDYDSLRTSCQINWEDILSPFNDDIENMWIHFKKELQDGILQFVPKQKKINTFKKDKWARPLSPSLREIIARKNRLWTRYIETLTTLFIKNTNQYEIKLETKHENYKWKNKGW